MTGAEQRTASLERWIARILLFLGVLEILALPTVFFPSSWIAAIHRGLGLGEMPGEPIVDYLARSLSAYYAAHGAITVFISRDITRYLLLVRFWAIVFVTVGVLFLVIDITAGLPILWIATEGTFEIVFGSLVLFLLRARSRAAAPVEA